MNELLGLGSLLTLLVIGYAVWRWVIREMFCPEIAEAEARKKYDELRAKQDVEDMLARANDELSELRNSGAI